MTQEFQLTGDAVFGFEPEGNTRIGFGEPSPVSVRLGAIVQEPPAHVLRLANYVDESALTLPPSTNWATKASGPLSRMYQNHIKGCCVLSGRFHNFGVWTGNDTTTAIEGADNEIDAMYELLKAGPGDSGCIITHVLDYFRDYGLQIGGVLRRIDGYVAVDNTRQELVKAAIYWFGGLAIGIRFPRAWLSSSIWDVTDSPIVGGHDAPPIDFKITDATPEGLVISSWGRLYLMTWQAALSTRYITEMYAMLSPNWYNADNLAPNGFDAAKLKADLAKIGGGVIPDNPPPNPPAPPTPPTPGTTWTIKTTGPVTITGTGTKPVFSGTEPAAISPFLVPIIEQLLQILWPMLQKMLEDWLAKQGK